jgi:REP element-mobilizing transposase RayT
MPHSYTRNVIHLVFSTKYRRPLITDEIRGELHAYIIGILRRLDSPSLRTNTATDHSHICFLLSKTQALDYVVEEVKRSTSKWIKRKGDTFADFYWQLGYAAFSVGEAELERVLAYIDRQQEHHRQVSFQDEIRTLFREHGVALNEHFFFDSRME